MVDMLLMVLKVHFKATMSWATAVEGGVSVGLVFTELRADFGFVAGRLGLWALSAGRGSLIVGKESLLWDVPLMTLSMGSLNQNVFAVFLKLLWGEVQCGWYRSIRGSQKVVHWVVFIKLHGLGQVGTVRASMCNCTTMLGILNSRIPRHFEVT